MGPDNHQVRLPLPGFIDDSPTGRIGARICVHAPAFVIRLKPAAGALGRGMCFLHCFSDLGASLVDARS